jgi:hypothetical protein
MFIRLSDARSHKDQRFIAFVHHVQTPALGALRMLPNFMSGLSGWLTARVLGPDWLPTKLAQREHTGFETHHKLGQCFFFAAASEICCMKTFF